MRLAALFLCIGIIIPLTLFGCASGKSSVNNTVFRDSVARTVEKDSVKWKESSKNDTYQHDSIYKRDSVVVYVKGDTVIKDRWHWLTAYKTRDVSKTDTIIKDRLHNVTDTVKVNKYIDRVKVKEVEKPRSEWVKARLFVGDCVLLLLFLSLVSYIVKKLHR